MKRHLLFLLPLIALLSLSSCDDDEPYGPWLAGKVFTADGAANPFSPAPYWLLSFDGRGGPGYEGRFVVMPVDYYGNPLRGVEYYSGYYQSDWNSDCIFVTYDGYSAQQVWYVSTDYEQPDGWPWYDPNIIITIPQNAMGTLAGLSFYSGNYFE